MLGFESVRELYVKDVNGYCTRVFSPKTDTNLGVKSQLITNSVSDKKWYHGIEWSKPPPPPNTHKW